MSIKQKLLDNGILMKNGQTSFMAKQKLNLFLDEVMAATRFLGPEAPLLQRWFHINAASDQIPMCACCGVKPNPWVASNKYRNTCSKDCHHKLKASRAGKTKSGDIAKSAYALGRARMIDGDPDALKKLAKKAANTRRKLGVDKIIAAKAGKTKRETICENGMSIAQNARYKQLENAKNDFCQTVGLELI